MSLNESVLKSEERIAFLLRALYMRHGFTQYKMSKFEEYDLYAKNRDFLVSGNIITFTDMDGRLMALKPDVTLSIVKSSRDIPGYVHKVFYNENVYRVPHGSHAFKEIMQVGLECIGDTDEYNTFETVMLASRSLSLISERNSLNISHLGVINSLLDDAGLKDEDKKKAIGLIGLKNMHELRTLLKKAGAAGGIAPDADAADLNSKETSKKNISPKRDIDSIINILMLSGTPDEVIPRLKRENCGREAVAELETLTEMLKTAGINDKITIDFSVVSDMNYYNGIVFNGYVDGVPEAILNGGEYDRLLTKMGRRSRAIGFAVYMGYLERFFEDDRDYDVDAVIVYNDDTDMRILISAAETLIGDGLSVTAEKKLPDKLRYKNAFIIDKEGVLIKISGENDSAVPDPVKGSSAPDGSEKEATDA